MHRAPWETEVVRLSCIADARSEALKVLPDAEVGVLIGVE